LLGVVVENCPAAIAVDVDALLVVWPELAVVVSTELRRFAVLGTCAISPSVPSAGQFSPSAERKVGGPAIADEEENMAAAASVLLLFLVAAAPLWPMWVGDISTADQLDQGLGCFRLGVGCGLRVREGTGVSLIQALTEWLCGGTGLRMGLLSISSCSCSRVLMGQRPGDKDECAYIARLRVEQL
jgi:hypothetical protein